MATDQELAIQELKRRIMAEEMDHGHSPLKSRIKRYREITRPIRDYAESVRDRFAGFVNDPLKSLYEGYEKSMGIDLGRSISEYAGMIKNTQKGEIDPNAPAIQEAMGWLPGVVGATKWFHGTDEIFDKFDPERFRTGATERGSSIGLPDAVYLTDKEGHASAYGDEILEFESKKDYPTIDTKEEMNQWAKESGYDSFQSMIDDYYAGDAYSAADMDAYLARSLRDNPDGVIVDFSGIRDEDYGDLGKILVTPETDELIRIK